MKLEGIRQVTVVGAGAMGSQIALLLSQVGGYPVNIVDFKDEAVLRSRAAYKRYFSDLPPLVVPVLTSLSSGKGQGSSSF